VAIVGGDSDRADRWRWRLTRYIGYQASQGNDGVTISLKIFKVSRKNRSLYGHGVLYHCPETMVYQNGRNIAAVAQLLRHGQIQQAV
jgi:hypothetical protein